MRFIIAPITTLGAYIFFAAMWELHQSIAFTTQDGWGVSWGFIASIMLGLFVFFRLD